MREELGRLYKTDKVCGPSAMSTSLSHSPSPSLDRERDADSPMDKSALKRSSTDVEATVTLVQDAKHDVFDGDEAGVDPVYQAKARVLNDAFQEIGMGKYQVRALSRSADRIRKAERGGIVVPLHRRGVRLVCVRSDIFSCNFEC